MLTQGKDDDKEKWQNSWREACYTLSIEGTVICIKTIAKKFFIYFSYSLIISKLVVILNIGKYHNI